MNVKRLSWFMSVIFLLCVMLISLTTCSNTGVESVSPAAASESAGVNTIKITFDSCGGSDVAIAETEKNGAISMPANPQWKSYTFVGWYTDKDYTTEFVNSDLDTDATVYAKWENYGKTVCTEMLEMYEITEDISDVAQGWEWNQANRTLTFSGFTLDTAQIDEDGSSVGFVFPRCPNQASDDMGHIHTPDCPSNTLILTDGTVNTVDTSRAINEFYSAAIYSASPLIVKTSGSGTPGILNATAAQSEGVIMAIYAAGDITIESGNVTAIGGDSALSNSIGIGANRGNIYIKSGTVTAIGGASGAKPSDGKGVNGSFGLYGDKVQIDNGTVTAIGGLSKTALSAGILGKQELILNGGNISAEGDTAAASFTEFTLVDGTMVNDQAARTLEIKNASSDGNTLHTFVDDQNAILMNITIAP